MRIRGAGRTGSAAAPSRSIWWCGLTLAGTECEEPLMPVVELPGVSLLTNDWSTSTSRLDPDPDPDRPGRTGPGRPDPGRTGPGPDRPGRTGPGRPDPGRTGPGRPDPGRP